MRLSNPLRNFLTPNEQRILLFLGAIILIGCCLDFWGLQPLQASQTDLDSLQQVVKVDAPLNLDIRTAGLEELISLTGIGDKRARDIISYRSKHPFTSVNQLLNVKGIGPKTYAKILPDLLVFGDSLNVESLPKSTGKSSAKQSTGKAAKSTMTNMVNLNKATLAELCTLMGIGEVKAKAIIAWREENGDFDSVDDITKVKGIGSKTLEKNRDRLTVKSK